MTTPAAGRGQLGQQPQLGQRQVQVLAAAGGHTAVGWIRTSPAASTVGTGGRARRSSARTRAASSLAHHRLGHVVVGAGLQPADHVLRAGPRGDHDDRQVPLRPYGPADGEAVHPRQHQVEQHDVEVVLLDQLERGFPRAGLDDLVALIGSQAEAEAVRMREVILDEQEAVGRPAILLPPAVAVSRTVSVPTSLPSPRGRSTPRPRVPVTPGAADDRQVLVRRRRLHQALERDLARRAG